jgi:hypothetical protein
MRAAAIGMRRRHHDDRMDDFEIAHPVGMRIGSLRCQASKNNCDR